MQAQRFPGVWFQLLLIAFLTISSNPASAVVVVEDGNDSKPPAETGEKKRYSTAELLDAKLAEIEKLMASNDASDSEPQSIPAVEELPEADPDADSMTDSINRAETLIREISADTGAPLKSETGKTIKLEAPSVRSESIAEDTEEEIAELIDEAASLEKISEELPGGDDNRSEVQVATIPAAGEDPIAPLAAEEELPAPPAAAEPAAPVDVNLRSDEIDHPYTYEIMIQPDGYFRLYVLDKSSKPLNIASLDARWTLYPTGKDDVMTDFRKTRDGKYFWHKVDPFIREEVVLRVEVKKGENWYPSDFNATVKRAV